ncbi:hypothetical protein HJC23_005452 [Cyclotella cryptica]|uniref:Uncharacterized protein n=1 Tax=Cyclotella cryptica TaxID=29204 RepID=A0ABD3P3S1_9STRA
MCHASSVFVRTFTQQTATSQESAKELPLQDLALLKKEDPFLYYSIPYVRNAVLLDKDVELSSATSRYSNSELTGIINQHFTATRQSCLTFEFHSSKLMEDLIDLNSDDFEFDEDDEQEDDLYSYLAQLDSNPQSPSNPSRITTDTFPTLIEKTHKDQKLCAKSLRCATLLLFSSHFTQQTATPQESAKELPLQDLALLKKEDPFLYYSIPYVRNAVLLDKDVELSSATSRYSNSELTGIINQHFTATRQSCLTFEFHSSKLMEDLIDLNSDDFEFDEDDEQEDDLYSYLASSSIVIPRAHQTPLGSQRIHSQH